MPRVYCPPSSLPGSWLRMLIAQFLFRPGRLAVRPILLPGWQMSSFASLQRKVTRLYSVIFFSFFLFSLKQSLKGGIQANLAKRNQPPYPQIYHKPFLPSSKQDFCKTWPTSLHPAFLTWPCTRSFYLKKDSLTQQKYMQLDGQDMEQYSWI